MKRLVALILALVAGLVGCREEQAFRPPRAPTDLAAFKQLWQGSGKILFEAQPGIPVLQEEVDFLREEGGKGSDDALARKVGLRKLMAARAVEQGLAEDFEVNFAWRQALAQEAVTARFTVEHTPDTVPMATWEKLFYLRNVYPMFDHQDTYFVVDTQIICCSGDPDQCARDDYVQICLQDAEPTIWAAYEELSKVTISDPKEIEDEVDRLKTRYPELAIQIYSFQYDFDKEHDEQRHYNRVDRAVAFAARVAEIGRFAKPVRSKFGWHVLYVKEHLPEIHLEFGEPETMAMMKERLYDVVLHQDVMDYLGRLVKSGEVRFYEEAIRDINWSRITGMK